MQSKSEIHRLRAEAKSLRAEIDAKLALYKSFVAVIGHMDRNGGTAKTAKAGKPPGDGDNLPAELVKLLSGKKFSVTRSAFAIVYYCGPIASKRIYSILDRFGIEAKRTHVNSLLWREAKKSKRIAKDPKTKLYDFTSDEAREWFAGVLASKGDSGGNDNA